MTCGNPFRLATWSLPSRVLGMVTHPDGETPFEVTAVIKASNSSRFSFSFLTKLWMALRENDSVSPPCLESKWDPVLDNPRIGMRQRWLRSTSEVKKKYIEKPC